MVHVATFNLFWFPASATARNSRSSSDESLIEKVITALSADVLVFQEIFDVPRLVDLLGRIPGRQYQVCQASPPTLPIAGTNQMHLVLAFDTGIIACVAASVLADPAAHSVKNGRRLPVVGHFQHLSSGWKFTVVGVHLKSGFPDPSPTAAANSAYEARKQEIWHLQDWLVEEGDPGFGRFTQPPTTDVLLLGDFNLAGGNHLLRSLTHNGLPAWQWLSTRVLSSLEVEAEVHTPGEQWSTYFDRVFTDHVLVSPSLASKVENGTTTTFAFDLADAFATSDFRQKQNYECVPYQGASFSTVENLYRVSDHRPVRVSLITP